MSNKIQGGDYIDLAEFGISANDILKIQSVNQRVNLKKLKTILKETDMLINININRLTTIIVLLIEFNNVGELTNRGKGIFEQSISEFKDSLMDLIWNVDSIINDIEYGDVFKNEKDIAELKVIQIIEIINKANSEFERLDFDRLEFAYDEVERVIQSLEQIKFLLNTINELYNSLS